MSTLNYLPSTDYPAMANAAAASSLVEKSICTNPLELPS